MSVQDLHLALLKLLSASNLLVVSRYFADSRKYSIKSLKNIKIQPQRKRTYQDQPDLCLCQEQPKPETLLRSNVLLFKLFIVAIGASH